MKMTYALAALLAATTVASAAHAQSGGFRAEIQSGWDHVSSHQRTDVGTSGATTRQKDDGIVYGGEIGYDLGLGGFQLGAYAGLHGASTKECAEVFTEVQTCAKTGRNFSLGVRAGVQATPGVLLYAKGGYSNGQIKLEYIDYVTPASSFTVSDNMDGWHIGAGAQVDVLPNVYAKLEYVRTNYSDHRLKQGNATITGGLDRDNVVFGVGLRF